MDHFFRGRTNISSKIWSGGLKISVPGQKFSADQNFRDISCHTASREKFALPRDNCPEAEVLVQVNGLVSSAQEAEKYGVVNCTYALTLLNMLSMQ